MSPDDRPESMPERVTTIEGLQGLVGKELGIGPWLTMSQDRINMFADAVGDHQWIHVDPERCRTSGFGETIAHGYLTLSLITLLRQDMKGVEISLNTKMGINYGSDRVRFITPVRTGRRIRLRTALLELKQIEPLVWQAKYRHTVEVENEERPALVAEALNRIVLNG
jgi:acyl dehydratase